MINMSLSSKQILLPNREIRGNYRATESRKEHLGTIEAASKSLLPKMTQQKQIDSSKGDAIRKGLFLAQDKYKYQQDPSEKK